VNTGEGSDIQTNKHDKTDFIIDPTTNASHYVGPINTVNEEISVVRSIPACRVNIVLLTSIAEHFNDVCKQQNHTLSNIDLVSSPKSIKTYLPIPSSVKPIKNSNKFSIKRSFNIAAEHQEECKPSYREGEGRADTGVIGAFLHLFCLQWPDGEFVGLSAYCIFTIKLSIM
jgi:hypothetical protein